MYENSIFHLFCPWKIYPPKDTLPKLKKFSKWPKTSKINFDNLAEETSVIYTLWIWGRQPLADGHFGLFSHEISMLFFDSSMQLSPLVFQGRLLILKDNESNLKVMSLELR